jgi:demethylsterigmatocystin 6-O-methyltransferase
MPILLALPKFLVSTKHQNPSDPAHCAFQLGHNTKDVFFQWLPKNPANFATFNLLMTDYHAGQKTWLDVFPFEERFGHNLDHNTPLFVDVGGELGHQCLALKARFPTFPGRVILQDLPAVLAQALPPLKENGIELMPSDFWTEQPIKGARAYYMRKIMHDYPDEKCVAILKNITAAMGQESVILIDEIILPNKGALWRATQSDLVMMSCLAGMERSRKQWEELMEKAELRIVGVWGYVEDTGRTVIMAVPT